jgi:iron-sulfur cluster assembly protein
MVIECPVSFTENAITHLKYLSQQDDALNKMLRIGVKGGGCSGMSYVLGFDEKTIEDEVYTFEDLSFIMNKSHQLYLNNMQIDWQDGLNSRGFTFTNPNASKSCGCGSSFAV